MDVKGIINNYLCKLKGGILYYSLVVIILTSSMISLILLISFYEDRIITVTAKRVEIEKNVYSALNIYLSGKDLFKDNDSVSIDLYGSTSDKVYLNRKNRVPILL